MPLQHLIGVLEASLLDLGLLKGLAKHNHLFIARLKPPATLSQVVDRAHEDTVCMLQLLRAARSLLRWRLIGRVTATSH